MTYIIVYLLYNLIIFVIKYVDIIATVDEDVGTDCQTNIQLFWIHII